MIFISIQQKNINLISEIIEEKTTRIFDKRNVILLKINEDDLNSFLVDMDIEDSGISKFMLDELSSAIINTIPEYVFAHYEDPFIPQNETVDKLREAAKCIYKVKDYDLMRKFYLEKDESVISEIKKSKSATRGEFGELLLHLLLREFKKTIPLISKVYFKDSSGVPAHGFDSVHVSPNEGILWLGESKFYTDSKRGIDELIIDLSNHFKKDYLEEQFIIVKKNLENNKIPQRDKWINKLASCNKLKERISIINIPLLCIYDDNIYQDFPDINCQQATACHEKDIRSLKRYFDDKNNHPLKEQLNIILMLFPIKNKKELVTKLHERLWHMQNM